MSAINCSAGLAVVVVNLDVAVAEIVLRSWDRKICPPRAMNAVLFALDCKLFINILLHLTHTYQ